MSREGQDWQKNNTTLGALVGGEQDVHRRMQLANLAVRRFGLFAKVNASLEQKIRVGNALVRQVLFYSCETWV